MSDLADIEHWATNLLDMAYKPPLGPSSRRENVGLILTFFKDAEEIGIEHDDARITLHNEILDIMPVIEPLKHVLRRVRRKLRAGS